MTNQQKYDKIFTEVFGVEPSVLNDNFGKESVAAWDSVHQLNLVNLAEEVFDIMMDPDQIIEFTSYPKGLEILKTQGVEF